MTRAKRLVACALVALASLASVTCVEDGIGMGVPATGARWSAGPGPDILVAGGPVYR